MKKIIVLILFATLAVTVFSWSTFPTEGNIVNSSSDQKASIGINKNRSILYLKIEKSVSNDPTAGLTGIKIDNNDVIFLIPFHKSGEEILFMLDNSTRDTLFSQMRAGKRMITITAISDNEKSLGYQFTLHGFTAAEKKLK